MTIWDIYPKPIAFLMAIFIWVASNWFWIKWIVFAALIVALAIAIRKHNKKVEEKQKTQ